jgi:hypothetical protein
MSDAYEVISAFLDDEPFDPAQLADALSDPAGRALLLDFLALRHVVQPSHLVQPTGHQPLASVERQPRRASLKAFAAAAAVFVALAGGYFVGQRERVSPSEAPPATRVADAPAAWQEVLPGRTR